MAYFQDIRDGIRTTLKGLGLTLRHIRQATRRRQPLGIEEKAYFEQATGLVTVQYPHETVPIPDNGRYRLHNEIDDCIVCDKCAKICPVDCITIDPIKATEEVGRASDGSPIRLYAAQFDIDMAKCCYCGLCTVVCPTECLTMEKTFDYSTYELTELNYAFANLTPEQADEKRALYEQFVREKEAAKTVKPGMPAAPDTPAPAVRPTFRPGMKPASRPAEAETEAPLAATDVPVGLDSAPAAADAPKPRPAFRPGMKPKPAPPAESAQDATPTPANESAAVETPPRPAFRPTRKPAPAPPSPDATPAEAEAIAMQGVAEQPGVTEPIQPTDVPAPSAPASPRPAFRPTMKPAAAKPAIETPSAAESVANVPAVPEANATPPGPADIPRPKPAFRPTMKPRSAAAETSEATPQTGMPAADAAAISEAIEPPKPKPGFRPTMKPKQG